MTVLQVLTLAGGVTPRGSAGRSRIVRTVREDGEDKRKELKARPEDLVEPDDTIVVPERFF
jgi:protein involved in polysaccharide export with SLBB domain